MTARTDATALHPELARATLEEIVQLAEERGYVAERDGALVEWLGRRLDVSPDWGRVEVLALARQHGYSGAAPMLEWLRAALAEPHSRAVRRLSAAARELLRVTAELDEDGELILLPHASITEEARDDIHGYVMPAWHAVRKALAALEDEVRASACAVPCNRCGEECCDVRQRDGARICILCVERELERERALHAEDIVTLDGITAACQKHGFDPEGELDEASWVDRQLEQERANAAALRADVARLTAEVERVTALLCDQPTIVQGPTRT